MKTENEINNGILKTTMDIQGKFPELSKYITEMPVTIPDVVNPEITSENLKAYSESLDALVSKYSKNEKLLRTVVPTRI
jgi:hypothetical protein